MMEDSGDDDHITEGGDMEMAVVHQSTSSDSDFSTEITAEEYHGGSPSSNHNNLDLDSEYGEQTLEPQTVTSSTKSSIKNNDFYYKKSVRQQNCCFGLGMISFAGLFIAAYFFMGLSFTPANIGIFGDESAMKGGSSGKLFLGRLYKS